MAQADVSVDFELIGETKYKIDYHSPLLNDHVLDYPSVPADQHPGQSRRLLCASALACFAATTHGALTARGARVLSLTGRGTVGRRTVGRRTVGRREGGSEVGSIHIDVKVKVAEEDLAILDKVKKIMRKGCLITRSLAPGIAVTHSIESI